MQFFIENGSGPMSLRSRRTTHTRFNIEVGRRMKQLRLERGLTLVEFGRQLGVSFQQIQKYERGTNGVTVEKLLRAATILHVDLKAFWQDPFETEINSMPPSRDRGVISLVKTYNRISNPDIRQKLLELVRKIAETDALISKT
jgi:transcriptional regulator with XRE-family HTH domain